MQLELPSGQAEKVQWHLENNEADLAREIVWNNCKVASDSNVGQMPRKETLEGMSLSELHNTVERTENVGWVNELCVGVMSTACGNWPKAKWSRLYDEQSKSYSVLMMLRLDKVPSERRFLFTVCFPPECDDR